MWINLQLCYVSMLVRCAHTALARAGTACTPLANSAKTNMPSTLSILLLMTYLVAILVILKVKVRRSISVTYRGCIAIVI
jgi:hypothetical protein